jgi:hypothetical protein
MVSNPETNIFRRDGKNVMTTAEKQTSIRSNRLKISTRSISASFLPFWFSTLEKRGRNEALKAPSAKILRNVFAILMATMKASEYDAAPRENAMAHSRRNPVNLVKSMEIPTVKEALITPMAA